MPSVYSSPVVGRMNKRISIEMQTVSVGSDGDVPPTWTEFTKAWASLDPTGGTETYIGGVAVQQNANTFTIKMMYQDGINADMRALYRGRYFNFLNVNDTGELHRDLVIQAKEITA